MKNSKIVQYIFEFSPSDREKFTQFVHSPFFNQHQKTKQLYDIIVKQVNKKKVRLDAETVFKKLFPDEPFKQQKLHDLQSNLKKLLNRFYAAQYLEEHPVFSNLLTLETAYKRNQFDFLKNRANQLKKDLQKQVSRDETYYYANYRMNNIIGYYGGTFVNRNKPDRLQAMLNHLDRYYILEKLKNSCQTYAHHLLINAQYDWTFLDDVLNYLDQHKEQFKEDYSILLYQNILLSLRDYQNERHYQYLKKLLEGHLDRFNEEEQSDLFTFAYNYCILRINRGHSPYQEELFHLYEQGLETGLVFQHGVITEWNYKNIATLGAKLKKFKWTEDFITHYKAYLPQQHQENVYNYNLAYLYYSKGQYDKVLDHLLHVQYTDVKYHLSSSYLLVRTYHKLGNTEALLGLLDTFRLFVMRNKQMTGSQKKEYINFIRLAKKLILLKHEYQIYAKAERTKKLDKLRKQIEETDPLINRSWLLEECEEEAVASRATH
jgi:hypothetical protein